ncbi:hypothetical protein [Martelella sp. FOR1707]
MKNAAIALIFSVLPMSANSTEASYRCGDFHDDRTSITPAELTTIDRETLNNLSIGYGIVIGVFAATQKAEVTDLNDQKYIEFENRVLEFCNSNPTARITAAALTVAEFIPSPSDYTPMSLIDYNLDKAELVGHKVSLTGDLAIFGEFAMLRVGMFDTTPISVEIENLPRADRKFILENCSPRCKLTVNGTVKDNMFDQILSAESIKQP